jgi:Na+-transporting methylmalonyl-CoA/oxaloacetate decarboxylase gamma subunit
MEFDIVVTITGLVLVFFILVILMLIITLEGKIFDALNAKKKAKVEAAHAAVAEHPKEAAAPAAADAPEVEEGIPGEIVAAIAAAVYAMGNGKYTLRAVHRAANSDGRGAWGRAGTSDTTAPF